MKNLLCHAVCAACLSAAGLSARGAEPPAGTEVDIATLQRIYLACDRVASQRPLSFGEAAECSSVSEQLLRHGFGNDFDRLLAWWRVAKLAAAGPAAPVELARR
jgi:hypothetical protein